MHSLDNHQDIQHIPAHYIILTVTPLSCIITESVESTPQLRPNNPHDGRIYTRTVV